MPETLNNNTSNIPPNTKTEAVIKAPDEWKKVPEIKETQKDTQKKLEDLKKEIQEKGISFDMTKTLLNGLENIDPENRPFILWGIFSWLNHIWISLSGIGQDGKMILHPPKIPFKAEGNLATHEDTLRYSELLNNYIHSGKVSISDMSKWLLYRTSSVDDYVKEKADKSFSTPEYVQRLLKKYKIHVEWNIKDISFWSGIEWKKQFEAFKKDISFAISDNQADKEFLLAYFDDVYYRGGKSLSSDEITAYTQKSAENQKKVLSEISHLDEEQKFALWIRNSNDAKQLSRDATKDPIGFLKKNMTGDNITLALIFGIIWAFFGGKNWFWIGALLWFWVGAGGLAFAQEWWNKLGEKKEQKWNKPPEQRVLTPNQRENSIYSKVTFTTEADTAKKWELEKIWLELSKNDTFLNAPTTVLSIFESNPKKNFDEIKTELNNIWITLTTDNQEYYKTIFAEILKQRKIVIWEVKENETIKDYLERTSKKEDKKVAWVAWIAWIEKELKEEKSTTTEVSDNISDLENLKREWHSDLYILSRSVELWYTFTKTPPSWIKPSWSMWILGSTWYVIKTPLTIQAYKYMMSAWWYFITWWLHQSLQSWNLKKMVWWTGEGVNWIWNKASELLQLELRNEKAKLEKQFKWIDTKISSHSIEIEKIKSRLELLNNIDTALKSWNSVNIQSAFNDYKQNFDENFRWHIVGWKDIKLEAEIQKFQEIQTRIEKIEMDTKTQIQDLEIQAKQAKTPKEISELQTRVQEIAAKSNIEIEKINTDAALSLSKFDENTIKKIAQKSKFVDSLVNSNDGAEKFLNKFNWVWWKAFIWVWIISLLYNGRSGLGNMLENGISEENKNDAVDLWIWFIPVIGWIHDLKIAYEWKDLNNRVLSSGERSIRTAFWIIGLIPWVGTLVKWVLKWSSVAIKWADVAIQTTHIIGKWLTYSLLWYSIATASKEIYINSTK